MNLNEITLDRFISIICDSELLKQVLQLFNIVATFGDVDYFAEINKMYLAAVIDPVWAK